jgi:hypothetical protein
MAPTSVRMMITAIAYIQNPSPTGMPEAIVDAGTGMRKYQRAAAPSRAASAPARQPQMKLVSRMAGMKVMNGNPPSSPASRNRASSAKATVARANA